MNAFWNRKNLERPANNVWVASRKSIDLKKFVSALDAVIKDLESQDVLHVEAAILSRLIYRIKSKFRSDKGMKNMEKVNRALLNYLEIQLHKEYKDLRNYVERDGPVVNLPTKQMVQYVLVRTQGFAKLMCRIENVAKSAAEFFQARINVGHAWTVSVIAYSVVSRVWYLSRYLLKRCCAWYNSIFEHAIKFRQIGPMWLPDDYNLPENLKTWLNLPWIDRATDSVPLKDDGKETIFGLIKAQIDDPCGLNFDNEGIDSFSKPIDNSKTEEEIPREGVELAPEQPEVSFLADDVGTSIDRETFRLNLCTEVPNIRGSFKSKKKLKRKRTIPQNHADVLPEPEAKKSTTSVAGEIVLPKSTKRRRKSLTITVAKKEEEVDKVKAVVKTSKTKSSKAEKKSRTEKRPNTSDVKTLDDLTKFLSKDSYPGLDRLQWNMLNNSVKKFVKKLEKCGPSEEKRQRILLKKINGQIQNWIR